MSKYNAYTFLKPHDIFNKYHIFKKLKMACKKSCGFKKYGNKWIYIYNNKFKVTEVFGEGRPQADVR